MKKEAKAEREDPRLCTYLHNGRDTEGEPAAINQTEPILLNNGVQIDNRS